MKIDRAIKIIASLCFVLVMVALVLIWQTPAKGYEVSIYTATPIIVWGFLIASYICGTGIVVYEVYTQNYKKSSLWVTGLLLILLSFTIILSLHILRGYYMYGQSGDPSAHLGITQVIISTGHFMSDLHYPITHTFLAMVSYVLGVDPITLAKYIPVLFALVFVAFMFLVARSLFPHKGQVILTTVASTTFVTGSYIYLTPNYLANLFWALALYLLIKSTIRNASFRLQYKILFIIIMFLVVSFHFVPAVGLLLVLGTIGLLQRIFAIRDKSLSATTDQGFDVNIGIVILLLVWSITWMSSFYVWDRAVRSIYIVLTEGGPTQLDAMTATIYYATEFGYSVWEQFFKVWGGPLIYVVLTLVSLPLVWWKMPREANLRNLGSLYAPVTAFTLLVAILVMFSLPGGAFRYIVYALILSTFFVGFVLYEMVRYSRQMAQFFKFCLLFGVFIIIVSAFIVGMLIIYPSPYVLGRDDQLTQSHVEGVDWFISNRDTSIAVTGYTVHPGRLVQQLRPLPEQQRPANQGQYKPLPTSFVAAGTQMPYHFGYDTHSMLGESYSDARYMILSPADRLLHTEVFPRMAEFRFYPADFEKLEHDTSLDKLYINGGLDIWYIHPMAQAP